MNKKTKNITTYILGLIMMTISVYMFFIDMDLLHCLTLFILGLGVFTSYTKLSEILNKKIPR